MAMLEIMPQLQGLGKELTDEDVVAALLCGLSESYSTLGTALEGRAEEDLMVDYTRGKLIDQYSRHVETSHLNEVVLIAADYEYQTTNNFCIFCKKKGHIKSECWKLKGKRKTRRKVKRL
jgi:hypothetical protein